MRSQGRILNHMTEINSDTPMKRCTQCGEEKPATAEYFQFQRNGKYGLHAWCRVCCNKDGERRRREKGIKPAPRISMAGGYIVCPQCNEKKPATSEYFYPDKGRNSGLRSWCKKCINSSNRIYQRNRPSKQRVTYARQYAQNRRARKAGLPNFFDKEDRQRCLDYFNHQCAICGRFAGLWNWIVPDHWIAMADPRPDNPGNVPWNIVPMCHAKKDGQGCCNNIKSSKDPKQWLIERYGKRKANVILKRIEQYFEDVKSRHVFRMVMWSMALGLNYE